MQAMQTLSRTLIMFVAIVALAMVAGLLGCDSGSSLTTVPVSMTNQDQFVPRDILVNPGDTVVWTNDDTDPHAPVSDPAPNTAGGPNSDTVFPNGVPPADTYSWTVPLDATAGTVWFYHCRFHGVAGDGHHLGTGMVGSITVQ